MLDPVPSLRPREVHPSFKIKGVEPREHTHAETQISLQHPPPLRAVANKQAVSPAVKIYSSRAAMFRRKTGGLRGGAGGGG